MRDFNQWLGDLTSELQEKEDDHEPCDCNGFLKDCPNCDPAEIHGMWAQPEPCDVCGSAEEVCACEREDYWQDLKKQAAERMKAWHSRGITTRETRLPEPLDEYVSRALREKHENFEKDLRQCLQVPQEYMRETHDDLGTMSIAQARAIDPAVDPVGAQLDAQLRAMRAAKGHNKTATEVMKCQRAASLRIRQADHELQAYTQRFVRDMLRRAEREGDDE